MVDDAYDQALFAAMSRGEIGALGALYDRHGSVLFALAMHLVTDRPRAEDLLHDIYLDLARYAREPNASCRSVLRWLVVRLFERAGR
jgi:RNA polymerase sigma-70 factor, ECF subfamily